MTATIGPRASPPALPPPADIRGRIEWLGAHGDAGAVPDLADALMGELYDGDSPDWL